MVSKRNTIALIEGPNLNLIELRPNIYQSPKKLEEIIILIKNDFDVIYFQSNVEGEIINFLQKEMNNISGIIINPAAFTHYSIAIADCLEMINIPKAEVHLTNIYKRDREKSVTAKYVDIIISGAGNYGYYLASQYIKSKC